MILGIGVDVVSISRMQRVLERTPSLRTRLFTPHEREVASSRGSEAASLAARYAAKEAARKALRESLRFQDVEVVSGDDRAPSLHVAGRDDLRLHVSLSHDADTAIAFVVAEREDAWSPS